jgi:hypothetical protein
MEWRPKFYVSLAGAVLYGACLALVLLRRALGRAWRLGPAVAVAGPLLGLAAVLGLAGLDALGLARTGVRPDAFQVACGLLLQAPALGLSVQILRRPRPYPG